MKLQGSIELFQYWNRLRNGRKAPSRTEIEPSDIKGLLADTFILELDSRGVPVFRLAGTRLCAVYGRELKGFSFASLWSEPDQRVVTRLCQNAFYDKTVVTMNYQGVTQNDREVSFELALLPLDGGQESLRCLGIASSAEKPFWLGAEPVRENQLEAVRVIDPDIEPMFLRNRPAIEVPSLAPSERHLSDGETMRGQGRRIRHLVVFDGGREE